MFSQFIKRGHTVIDCGANNGQYTNFFRALVGKEGFVHAFEPVPETFTELQKCTKEYWHFKNYTTNMVGLYKECSNLIAYIPNSISGHASISNHKEVWNSDSIEEISIQLTTLDSYILNYELEEINFLKIDIEGAELDALRGGEKTLLSHKPTLHLEVNSQLLKNYNQKPRELIKFLKPLGYESFYYYDSNPHLLKSFEELTASKSKINTNVIATP